MATIYQNMDLGVLETRIGEALENCMIWGDLNLSREEYDLLNNKILEYLDKYKNRYSGYMDFGQKYPGLAVTQMINFVLYEFDGNHFWTPWSELFSFKLDPFEQSSIGKMITNGMKKFGFSRWEDDGLKYITPIICQAGIPTPSYDEIFDIIEGTLNDFYFSPADLISEINSGKFYHIEKGPERFFRLYPEKSVDLVNSIRVMLQTLNDATMSTEKAISIYSDLPPRIIERYLGWLSEDIYTKSARGGKVHFAPPRLFFSDEGKGIVIFLPEQTIRDEYIYKTYWKIYYDKETEPSYYKMQLVLNSERSAYINNCFAAVDLASEYRVELWGDNNDERPIQSWEIPGFVNKDYLLFDNNGRIGKSDTLSFEGSSILVLAEGIHVLSEKDITLFPIRLPLGWGKLEAYTVVPREKDGCLTIGSNRVNHKLFVKYSYDLKLISMGNLFREEYTEKSIPVFIRWPALQIGSGDEKIEDIENWEIRLRSINTGDQISCFNRDFIGGEEAYYDLEFMAFKFERFTFGKYEVKVYRGREFKKSFLFYMAPYIESSDTIKREWPSEYSNVETTGFMLIKNADDYEIDFITNVRIEKYIENRRTWDQITTYDPGTKIEGVLSIKSSDSAITIPFQKTVRRMKWSFWNEATSLEIQCRGTKVFSLHELDEGTWWLSLSLSGIVVPESVIELVLQTRNKQQLQKIEVKLNGSGNFSLPLGSFQSTIENFGAGSLSVMFHYIDGVSEEERWVSLCEFKDISVLHNLKYHLANGKTPVIFWDKTDMIEAEKLQLTSLTDPDWNSYVGLNNLRCNSQSKQYVQLKTPLPPGIYQVKPYEEIDDFLIEDQENQYSVFEYDPQKLIRVDTNAFAIEQAMTLYDWLVLTVIHSGNSNNIGVIGHRMLAADIQVDIDFEKAGKILFSLFVNIRKDVFPLENKEKITAILNHVFQCRLGNKERGALIPILLNSSMNPDDKEAIIDSMGLYRFFARKGVLNSKEIRDLWDLDRTLAALWIMKTGEVASSNVDRLINLFGIDFIHETLSFSGIKTDETDRIQLLKAALTGQIEGDDIYIRNSEDIWGNTKELIDMIDFGDHRANSKIKLDPKKRSTIGKLFAGTRYLDLLIEWYRETAFDDNVNAKTREIVRQAETIERSLMSLRIDEVNRKFGRILEFRKSNDSARYKVCYYCAFFLLMEALVGRNSDPNVITLELNDTMKKISGLMPMLYKRDLLMSELYALMIDERGAMLCQ
jgi:hypothetical protein